jgi:5'-nucleotidase
MVGIRGWCWGALWTALTLAYAAPVLASKPAYPILAQAQSRVAMMRRFVAVRILAINDFHGYLRSPGVLPLDPADPRSMVPAGGIEVLAGLIQTLTARSPHYVIVSAGDLIGASPFLSAYFQDEPTIEAMNLLGLDLNAVGNHEFDEGHEELLRMQYGGCHPVHIAEGRSCRQKDLSPVIRRYVGEHFRGAKFRFLAANVRDRVSGAPLFPPYQIRDFRGERIAFIGVTLRTTPNLVKPSRVATLAFGDEADTVNDLIPELRSLGIRAVVVLLHEGGIPTIGSVYNGCVGVSGPIATIVRRLDPEVDLVISGHSYEAYNCRLPNRIGVPIPVTSAQAYGRMLSVIDLRLDRQTKDVASVTAENLVVNRTDVRTTPAPLIGMLVKEYERLSAGIERKIIGTIRESITRAADDSGESALGNLVADAQLEATRSGDTGGAVVAFTNPGGIRADLASSSMSGEVTYGDAFRVQPFGGNLVTLSLTGSQIETMLEQQFEGCAENQTTHRILQVSQGFEYAWNPDGPACDKVDPRTIRIGGVRIEPKRDYRVTVNDFLAEGGDGFQVLLQGRDRSIGVTDIQALEEYLKRHSPVVPPPRDRIKRFPQESLSPGRRGDHNEP